MATQSIWKEIRISYFLNKIRYVDGYLTEDPDEEGKTIATVNMTTGEVEYKDERAKEDSLAQEQIQLILDTFGTPDTLITEPSDAYTINSVTRQSDKVTFTIGDDVTYTGDEVWGIVGFGMKNGNLAIFLDNGSWDYLINHRGSNLVKN